MSIRLRVHHLNLNSIWNTQLDPTRSTEYSIRSTVYSVSVKGLCRECEQVSLSSSCRPFRTSFLVRFHTATKHNNSSTHQNNFKLQRNTMVDQKSGYPQSTQDDSSNESSDEGSSLDLTLSSGDGPHTGTTTGSSEAKRQRQEIQHLIEKETRYVNAWRALVATAMIIIGAGACVLTFLFLSNGEELAFYNGVSNILFFPRSDHVCFIFL